MSVNQKYTDLDKYKVLRFKKQRFSQKIYFLR